MAIRTDVTRVGMQGGLVAAALLAHVFSAGVLFAGVLLTSVSAAWAQGYQPLPGTRMGARTDVKDTVVSMPDATPSPVMTHLPGRERRSLNGRWQVLVDPYASGIGEWKAVWKDRAPSAKHEFFEYGFDDASTLEVPGDFNTQRPELHWLEGSVWYRKGFDHDAARARREGRRLFVRFGAANYRADVFLNGEKVGSHEGGFTPFEFELTGQVRDGANRLLVHVNNERRRDGVPAQGFDWFNYGGLTRDVDLVETPATYIRDYFIQLAPGSSTRVEGWVQLDGTRPQQPVRVRVPELHVDVRVRTDADGRAPLAFEAPFERWSPDDPRLYRVLVSTPQDTLEEEIGFRNIQVRGDEILLNGEPVFLRGVNVHEEIDGRRAASGDDARRLLEQARELGANFVRLSHYPFDEHLVRQADRVGLLLWQEIPVYQGIDFDDPGTRELMQAMLAEMIGRDRNRASVAMWGIANETSPGDARNAVLSALATQARTLDPTRPIAAALYGPGFQGNTLTVSDPLIESLDVVGVNEYYGWYVPWPVEPEEVVWTPLGKPLLISEFGAEARHGNRGAADVAGEWNEEFQAEFYRRQLRMLERIPFLSGVVPWVLADFRSPVRLHPFQDGYNRKGLLSDRGEKKLAWDVIGDYYSERATSDAAEIEAKTATGGIE